MKKQIREQLKDKYSLEIINKALAKVERWMRNAYGEVDWAEYDAETGSAVESVEGYCKETVAKPDGKKTWNRGF